MSCRARSVCLVLVLALAGAVWIGCQPGDPKARILNQRARWDVQLLNWIQTNDGALNATVRVSGPPNSDLPQLTVRFEMLDASGEVRGSEWRTFDLSQAPRGGPADLAVRLRAVEYEVEQLAIVNVLDPTPEEEPHIKELQP